MRTSQEIKREKKKERERGKMRLTGQGLCSCFLHGLLQVLSVCFRFGNEARAWFCFQSSVASTREATTTYKEAPNVDSVGQRVEMLPGREVDRRQFTQVGSGKGLSVGVCWSRELELGGRYLRRRHGLDEREGSKSGSEAEDDAAEAPRRDIRRAIPSEGSRAWWKRADARRRGWHAGSVSGASNGVGQDAGRGGPRLLALRVVWWTVAESYCLADQENAHTPIPSRERAGQGQGLGKWRWRACGAPVMSMGHGRREQGAGSRDARLDGLACGHRWETGMRSSGATRPGWRVGWLVSVEWTPRPRREMKCHTHFSLSSASPLPLFPHPPATLVVHAQVLSCSRAGSPRMCLASQRHDMQLALRTLAALRLLQFIGRTQPHSRCDAVFCTLRCVSWRTPGSASRLGNPSSRAVCWPVVKRRTRHSAQKAIMLSAELVSVNASNTTTHPGRQGSPSWVGRSVLCTW